MINEERIKIMTRMAMEEKKNGPLPNIIGISKKEYISSRRLVAFVITTFIYGILFVSLAALTFLNTRGLFTSQNILIAIIAGLALYFILLYVVLRLSKKRSIRKYRIQRTRIKNILAYWDELEKLYED